MSFDPCNHPLKIQESIKTPTPKMVAHLGVCEHSLTLSYTPGNMKCDSRASLLAHTFASPSFGREPKAKVVTTHLTYTTARLLHYGTQMCGPNP